MSYDENVNAASSSDVNIVNQKLQLEFLFEINFKLFFHDIYSASSPVLCISRLHQIISSQKPSLSHELFQFLNSKFWIIQTYISFMIFLHLTMNLVGISTHISIYVQPILVYNLVSVVMIYILILFYEKLNKSKELFFQIQSTNRVNNVMKSFLGSTGFTFKEDVRDGKNKKTFEYSTRSVDKTGMTTVAACNSTLPGNRTGHGHSWFKLPMSRSKSASTSQTKLLPSVDTTVPTDSNTHEKTGAIYSITKFLTGKRSKSFTSKSHLTPATLPSPHPPSSLFGQSRMPSTESHLPESDNGSVSSDDDDAHQVEIELDNDGNGGWKTLDFDASCNEVKKAITGPRGSVALRRGQPNDKNNSSQSTPTTPRGSSVLRSSSDPELNKLAKSMLQQQSIHRGSQPLVSADPPLSSKHRLYFPTTPFNSDAFFNYSPDMSEPARNMFRDRAHCHSFKLRGASYLQDSEKVDPGPPLFKLMLMELYEVEPKVSKEIT